MHTLDFASESLFGRVAVLTQAILDELQSEVKEEKRETNEEKFLDKSDSQWKKMDEKFKKEDHRTTQVGGNTVSSV